MLRAVGNETFAKPCRITGPARDVSRCATGSSCEDATDRITRSDDAYVFITLRVMMLVASTLVPLPPAEPVGSQLW